MLTGLLVHFECGDLFVYAHVERLRSIAEAREVLSCGPTLNIANNWILLHCKDRYPRRLCPYDGDACGRWPKGADRKSLDDFHDAQLSIPDFVRLCPEDYDFRPIWFSIVEYEMDAEGHFQRTIASESESIYTLA